MKSLKEYLIESGGNINLNAALTLDLVDMYYADDEESAIDTIWDSIGADEYDAGVYGEFYKLLTDLKCTVSGVDAGNLYDDPKETLIEIGEIKKSDHGIVLNADGDDGRSTVIVFGKKPNTKQQKWIDDLLMAYHNNSRIHLAEQF